jgi:hypothetical protein
LVVLLVLIVMVSCTLVFVAPTPVLNALAGQSADLADSLDFELYSAQWLTRLVVGIFFALLLDAILVFVLVLELRRPSRKAIRIEKAAGGEVQVSIASISDRLKYEVDQLTDILNTRPRLSGKRSGVAVELDVDAAAGVNVPEKAGVIVETARQVIEDDMGLKLARPPKVNLRVVSSPKGRRYPARPREAQPVEPAPEGEAPLAEPAERLPVEPEVDLFAPPPDDESAT